MLAICKKCVHAIAFALVAAACTNSDSPKQQQKQASEVAAPASKTDGADKGEAPKAEGVQAKRRVFVANYQGDTISVVEGDPGMEVSSIELPGSPHGMDIRKGDPPILAVARSTDFGVTLYNADTLEKLADIETNRGPQDLGFSRDGKLLYVISPLDGTLQTVDVETRKLARDPFTFKKKPRRMIVDPATGSLFVLLVASTSNGGSEIAVVDPVRLSIERRIPVGVHPQAMALGNNGRTLASASFDESTLTVVDTKSLEVVATHSALTGAGLTIHPHKPIAYSSESFDDTIQVLNLESGEEIATLSPGQWPTYAEITADGRYLYVPQEESDSVVKIDTETNTVVAKIAVGKAPIELAIYEP